MSSSSRELEASGKPDAVFSCHCESGPNTYSERNRSNESGTVSRVVFILFLELLTQRVMGWWQGHLFSGGWPPWSWWAGLVPFRIRTWQGSEEPARGHRCGWSQGSHRVWEGTASQYRWCCGQQLHPSGAPCRVPRPLTFATPWRRSPSKMLKSRTCRSGSRGAYVCSTKIYRTWTLGVTSEIALVDYRHPDSSCCRAQPSTSELLLMEHGHTGISCLCGLFVVS